jgi:hypothetical protein
MRWRDKPLPSCATIPIDPEAKRKHRRCSERSPDDVDAAVTLKLDEARTREFLASCPRTSTHSVLHHPIDLTTLVTVRSNAGVLARIASAPFVESVSQSCPSEHPRPKHD